MKGSAARVLVTGGAGFVGSHLCRALVAAGHEVIALDSLLTGSRDSVRDLAQSPRFSLVVHDVVQPFDRAVDYVYHLACAASPPRYQADPVHTTLTSVVGTHNALLVAERHGARFLLASTSEIYGDPEEHPQRESYRGSVNPIGPRACYDEGKRCAESLTMDFHRKRGVDVRIARIFNTYGPAMDIDDGRVVSNFVAQALRGDALTVYGDGTQTRSLCFVSDMVRGLVGLMERGPRAEPVNLGNPVETTVLEIAERVIRLVGRGRIEHRPLPVDDPRRRLPDIARAREAFGFEPLVPLDDGLPATVADFARRLGMGAASPVAVAGVASSR